jgi:hypothetical protein
MKQQRMPRKLPKEFKKYFWDVDFRKLSLRKYSFYVLERVLRLGDLNALRWLLRIPKKKILDVVEKSRELDKKTRNYWRVLYG